MSSASHNLKQVRTRLLAGDKPGQHGQCKHRTTDVPGPSRPPPTHPRLPTEYVDPPCCCGRLKTPPRRVSHTRVHKCTYQVGCVRYKFQMLGEYPRAGSDQQNAPKLRIQDHAHHRQHNTASCNLPYMVIAWRCRTWTLHIIHLKSIWVSHWNKKDIHLFVFLPMFLWFSPYSLRGSVENSSCMGFIFSSLHKHDLISVIEYSSFTLVITKALMALLQELWNF